MTNTQRIEVAYWMNLTGFEKLIQQCEALGKAYDPSDSKLKLTALNKLKDEMIHAIKESRGHEKTYVKEYSERSTLDWNMRQITREILRAFPRPDAFILRDEMKKMSREELTKRERPKLHPLLEKIRQLQYTPGVVNRNSETDGAGVREQHARIAPIEWYRKQTKILADLAGKLEAHESYTPDTDEIKPEALQARAHDMQQKNEALETAAKEKKQADEKLHSLFYDPENGMVAIANAVKEYIAAEADPEHEAARVAAVIRFNHP